MNVTTDLHLNSLLLTSLFTLPESNGSAAYKSLIYSLLSTVLYIVVYDLYNDEWREGEELSHPYVISALIAAFMLLLSSKVTFSYNRVRSNLLDD